jgi:hypothetical protein
VTGFSVLKDQATAVRLYLVWPLGESRAVTNELGEL